MQRSVRADRQERQAREHHCLDRDEVAAKPMTVHQRYQAFRRKYNQWLKFGFVSVIRPLSSFPHPVLFVPDEGQPGLKGSPPPRPRLAQVALE
jgi:hypothetical protein